jgi:rSAM/selenodomain-associated transferase 2
MPVSALLASAAPVDRKGLISVIIPVWGEDEALAPLVAKLRTYPEIREVIVSATKPQNGLAERVAALGAAFVLNEEPNRGQQFNRGAEVATADWLMFHHADTELSRDHIAAVAALDSKDVIGGAFYRKFDERHPWLRGLERFERWHSRAFGTIYGDQSIFVRREHCLQMGGFAPIPLMEDVEFSARLRRSGKIRLLDPPVGSCPRRQIEQGAWTVTLRNLLFLILFRFGVPAQRLHSWYYSSHRPRVPKERMSPAETLMDPK